MVGRGWLWDHVGSRHENTSSQGVGTSGGRDAYKSFNIDKLCFSFISGCYALLRFLYLFLKTLMFLSIIKTSISVLTFLIITPLSNILVLFPSLIQKLQIKISELKF